MGKKIILTEEQFKHIINEGLNEYGTNDRREYFRQKALGALDSNANRPDELGQFKVTTNSVRQPITDKLIQQINIYNIESEDTQKIINVLGGTNKQKYHVLNVNVPRDRFKDKTAVSIQVLDNDIELWKQTGLQEIEKLLTVEGNYSKEELSKLDGLINNQVMSKQEMRKEFATNQMNAVNIWTEYLKNINDPKVTELLKTYSRIGIDKTYGHILSVKNVAVILAKDSTATFIAPESKWAQFNRYVVPNAKKYIVYVPTLKAIKKMPKGDIARVIDKLGWGNTAYNELPIQAQTEVDLYCQEQTGEFIPCIEFDVQDTKVIPGKEDLFTQQAGLLNNLTGELNAVAKDEAMLNGGEQEENELEVQRTQLAANYVLSLCEENNINVNLPNKITDASKLIKGLKAYYFTKASKAANIDKETNKEIFADNATHFTLIFTKLAWKQLGTFSHSVEYTQKEAAEFLNLVSKVVQGIEETINKELSNGETKSMVAENVNNNGLKQRLINAFSSYCKENNIRIVKG